MAALKKLEDKDTKNIRDCLNSFGADYILISASGGRNSVMPQFNDFEIDALPDQMIGLSEMEEYGYTQEESGISEQAFSHRGAIPIMNPCT